ncbi:cellular repressor of E1A-stimulated genes 2, isoform CRA_a [Homo sapiens]|uniref:protein CREG2 isoform X1 n=1 Tax=Homo sapiens TaxID=9606 RepID=UPI0000EE6D8A|nr:protein CREG2 isoform X1 [Homo sapiens]EAX01814.1 cellular repressor of E1A-stimulated genes 2, isoform CRA_a [Homo sapiens]
MSVRRGRRPARPGTRLSWLLCCSALLSPAAGYVIVSSVSWAVTNEVDEELDSASTEEAMPALLEDSGSIWQQSFPASAHKEDAHLRPRAGAARARPPPAPPGMFSYRREGGQTASAPPGPRLRAATARSLAHASVWGCLATVSTHKKIQGLPFGNCLPVSDGPFNNSTGIPFFYMTAKDPVVADLMKNPMASLMLPESEGEFCRDMCNKEPAFFNSLFQKLSERKHF